MTQRCKHTKKNTHTLFCSHSCTHKDTHRHTHAHTHTRTHTLEHMHTHTHACTHTHAHTLTHIRTLAFSLCLSHTRITLAYAHNTRTHIIYTLTHMHVNMHTKSNARDNIRTQRNATEAERGKRDGGCLAFALFIVTIGYIQCRILFENAGDVMHIAICSFHPACVSTHAGKPFEFESCSIYTHL